MSDLRGFVRNAGKALEQRDADIRRLQDKLAEHIEKTRAAEEKLKGVGVEEFFALRVDRDEWRSCAISRNEGLQRFADKWHKAEAELASLRSSQAGLLRIIEEEPALPGPITDKAFDLANRYGTEIALRAASQGMKDSILRKVRAAISSAQLSSQEPDQLGKTEDDRG